MVAIYINMIMVYFERKGYVQRNLYLNSVSLQEGFEKISHGSVSSACNRRRHWPECVGRVNRTFCFTGAITGRSCSKAD